MELKQKELGRGKQSFKISGENLQVCVKNRYGTSEFQVPLYTLGKAPQTIKYNPLRDIILTTFFSVTAAVCLSCAFIFKVGDEALLIVFGFISLVITPFVLYHWITSRYNYLIFFNIFSGQQALVLWINNPDKEHFEPFVKCLIENIEKCAKNSKNAGAEMGFAGEIRKLHDLWEEGIISEEEYVAGKSKVLSTDGDEWKY